MLGRGYRVGLGDQPAEVRPAPGVLDEEGDVNRARDPPRNLHGQLRAHDRPYPDALAGVGELHRPADVVVVGQRERLVAEVCRGGGELGRIGQRRREGVGRWRCSSV